MSNMTENVIKKKNILLNNIFIMTIFMGID